MEHTIWLSIRNGGDGSAYARVVESGALCEIDQEYMDEPWGENCCSCVTVESNTPVVIKDVYTVHDAIQETMDDIEYQSENDIVRTAFLNKKLDALKELEAESKTVEDNQMADVVVYAIGICHLSACIKNGVSKECAVDFINTAHPTGLSSGWSVSTDTLFVSGVPNPCPCEDHPNRRHFLFCC